MGMNFIGQFHWIIYSPTPACYLLYSEQLIIVHVRVLSAADLCTWVQRL